LDTFEAKKGREITARFWSAALPRRFEGALGNQFQTAKTRDWERGSKPHNVLSFFCSNGKRRSTAALQNASEE